MNKNYATKVHTFQDAAEALGNGTVLSMQANYNLISIEVTGDGTNTITFEAQFLSGGGWYAIPVYELPTLDMVTTTATKGRVYQTDLAGILNLRCRVSAYTDGEVSVIGRIVS